MINEGLRIHALPGNPVATEEQINEGIRIHALAGNPVPTLAQIDEGIRIHALAGNPVPTLEQIDEGIRIHALAGNPVPTLAQIGASLLLQAPQHGAGAIGAPTLPQIDAVASVDAGEAAMRSELAWGIQAGFGAKAIGQIPVVAKVVAVNGGYHEFEMVRTKAVVANPNGTGRLLNNAGHQDNAGNRFRVPDGDIGGLARHADGDVIVFDRLTGHATPGMVTINDIAQH
jgi:hypothetical protein